MILQSLYRLYERRAAASDPAERLAPIGFEAKEIPFILELDRGGRLIQIRDTRIQLGKKKIGKTELVPQGTKKTSGVTANLLWDTAEYVLGVVTVMPGKTAKPDRIAEQHQAFRARIDALPDAVRADAGVAAVLAFLDTLDLEALAQYPQWDELLSNPLLTFQLAGDADLVCQRPAVRAAWMHMQSGAQPDGICLVTGDAAPIERLHSAIKGVWGAQTSGANIVSFNLDAFSSYGKTQGQNAPVGQVAATMYTTALNALLARGSRQRIQVGDTSTVFWSEQKTDLEDDFALVFGEPAKDDPAERTERVRALYESFLSGKYAHEHDQKTRFYVLGLAPNAARLSVRFWHVDTVANLAQKIAQHFNDLLIAHGPRDTDTPSVFRLLSACAAQGKADNIPPNLGGEVMRAILGGTAYPATWLAAAVRRSRAEQDVNALRAAVIKACINRSTRLRRTGEKEIAVSLDIENPNLAYRLGRLFAALEKIQEEASPGLNATIRDRYYGAASASPVTVFTTLMRLKNHHLSKLDNRGRANNFERLIGEIMAGVDGSIGFPAQLPLQEQGRFAIGYYHQRQSFFTKANPATNNAQEQTP
ncbi:MAG: type I-C CRISPR-associated protein Cas8c/Csd1 [Xanthomonadaceae bacterium]|nr:type I-C CRISPR-associated protein Cas8c/Csd1 [Xanthomonadaceae bacterium]MDP2186743.1 type I-C CRISPR-associated protein Cas8c/Csd1 [Xanthomonadales bacterium]MDZ4117275.1 type I-C CRISPR-associated protein Cas8c/Csd1 [Xanthomonadaceae bacterium]MDZ4376706.1 type I-C CRISPR-associated protein Cas8c/Csd1 [Xanthomonadaceae bacterium]